MEYCTKFQQKNCTSCTNVRKSCRGARARHGKKKVGHLAPHSSHSQLGDTIIVVLAVGEHPTVGRARLPYSRKIFAVIGDVTCKPTLQMVGAVSGEDFSRGKIVGGVLLHGVYLPYIKLALLRPSEAVGSLERTVPSSASLPYLVYIPMGV